MDLGIMVMVIAITATMEVVVIHGTGITGTVRIHGTGMTGTVTSRIKVRVMQVILEMVVAIRAMIAMMIEVTMTLETQVEGVESEIMMIFAIPLLIY